MSLNKLDISNLSQEILRRNYGLDKHRIKITDFIPVSTNSNKKVGGLYKVHDDFTSAFIWLERKGESLSFVTDVLGLVNTALESVGIMCKSIERLNIDATNQHFLLIGVDGTRYHMKIYTRMFIGSNEVTFSSKLCEFGMFPKLYTSLQIQVEGRTHTIFALFEEISEQENADTYTGSLLRDYISSQNPKFKDDFVEFTARSINLISRFHIALGSIIIEGLHLSKLTDEAKTALFNVKEYLSRWVAKFNEQIKKVGLELNFSHLEEVVDFSNLMTDLEQPIHGDLWWRQLILTMDKLEIMDIEDVLIGSPLYDFASHYSGIINQINYFLHFENLLLSKAKEIHVKLRDLFELSISQKHLFYRFLILRSLKELHYAIKHWENSLDLSGISLEETFELFLNRGVKLEKIRMTANQQRYFLIDTLIISILYHSKLLENFSKK